MGTLCMHVIYPRGDGDKNTMVFTTTGSLWVIVKIY